VDPSPGVHDASRIGPTHAIAATNLRVTNPFHQVLEVALSSVVPTRREGV
jgi:hypothetical protein